MKREGRTPTLFGIGDSTVSGSVVVSTTQTAPARIATVPSTDASKPPTELRSLFCSTLDVSSSGPGHVKLGPTQRVTGLTHRRKVVGLQPYPH